MTITENIRSAAWAAAKPAALDAWANGSADTTQMLIAASRAVDAALETVTEIERLSEDSFDSWKERAWKAEAEVERLRAVAEPALRLVAIFDAAEGPEPPWDLSDPTTATLCRLFDAVRALYP